MHLIEIKKEDKDNQNKTRTKYRKKNNNKFYNNFDNKINVDEKKDDNPDGLINYSFGNYFYPAYVNPSYPCLYYELLKNNKYQIEEDEFKTTLDQAKKIAKKESIKNLKCKHDAGLVEYGVNSGDSLPLSSICSILFYTNFDDL